MNKSEKDYLDRLTNRPHTIKWKLVKIADGDCWYPNWSEDRVLIFLQETLSTIKKPKRSKTYYIYCCGQDDCERAIRNLDWSTAKNLFNEAAVDGISHERLEKLGIKRGC